MVTLGSKSQREIKDYMQICYTCYLIRQRVQEVYVLIINKLTITKNFVTKIFVMASTSSIYLNSSPVNMTFELCILQVFIDTEIELIG